MPSMSARQIITTALRLIGVASSEQPLSAAMAEGGLDALNTLLDGWSVERLLTWTRPLISLSLIPGKADYTWGLVPGETTPADIPQPAPVRLDICLLNIGGSPAQEWPILVVNQEEWEGQIWFKTLQSTYPELVYVEDTVPYNVLHIYPVPTVAYTLLLLPWQAHSPYAAYDAVLDWPAGFARAFQFNLALELAPQYGVEPSPMILRTAEESKRALYTTNTEIGRLSLDPRRPRAMAGLGYNPAFLRGD